MPPGCDGSARLAFTAAPIVLNGDAIVPADASVCACACACVLGVEECVSPRVRAQTCTYAGGCAHAPVRTRMHPYARRWPQHGGEGPTCVAVGAFGCIDKEGRLGGGRFVHRMIRRGGCNWVERVAAQGRQLERVVDGLLLEHRQVWLDFHRVWQSRLSPRTVKRLIHPQRRTAWRAGQREQVFNGVVRHAMGTCERKSSDNRNRAKKQHSPNRTLAIQNETDAGMKTTNFNFMFPTY